MVISVPSYGESAKLKTPSKAGKYWRNTEEGWLGVYVQEINHALKEAMNLKSEKGVLVRDVVEDSPAEKAGIEREDVILTFGGKKVPDTEQLIKMVKKTSPGDEVEMLIVRDGKEKTLTITIGESPEKGLRKIEIKKSISPEGKLPKIKPEIYKFSGFSGVRIGVKVEDLTEQLGEYFGAKDGEGALVTEVDEDGPAYKAGLKAGDMIVEADGKKIEDTEDLIGVISDKEEGDKVGVKAIRDRKSLSFTVEVEKGEEWSSDYLKGLEMLKILPGKSSEPQIFWGEKEFRQPRKELREEIGKLKEEMKELREELENLKEKLK
jgi:predicted metalloprotease with PDZ domain